MFGNGAAFTLPRGTPRTQRCFAATLAGWRLPRATGDVLDFPGRSTSKFVSLEPFMSNTAFLADAFGRRESRFLLA